MEARFLTPTQLWQEFVTGSEQQDVNYVSSQTTPDGIVEKSLFFTAFATDEGRVRAYAKLFIPEALPKNGKKFILYIADPAADPYASALQIARRGYPVGYLDLRGMDDTATLYEGSFAYGKWSNAQHNLHNCTPSALASPVLLWTKMLSQFVTLLMGLYPKIRIIAFAERLAHEILWPLCAMDDRMYGGISVLGDYVNEDGGETLSIEDDENARKWDIALSPQAYAKYTNCPMLLVTTTNYGGHSFERLDTLVNLMPEPSSCATVVSNRLCRQISQSALFTTWRWVEGRYLAHKELPKNPELYYEATDRGLEFVITPDQTDKKAVNVSLYYAYNEQNPEYRSWHCLTAKGEEFRCVVPIAKCDTEVVAYASVRYRDGVEIASTPVDVQLTPDMVRTKLTPTKLLYDTGMEPAFFAETAGVELSADAMKIAKCPKGIEGLCVEDGDLVSFCVGERRRLVSEGELQLSVYTEKEVTIEITLSVQKGDIYYPYTAKVYLPADTQWQRVRLEATDFRDEAMLPMPDWQNMKKLRIGNAQGVLINNLLWV